jgi:hypothetical protein
MMTNNNELARRYIELEYQQGLNNVNSLSRGNASATTINSERFGNEIRRYQMMAQAGFISQQEAATKIAELEHQRDINNVNNMVMGGVSEYTINKERIETEKRYLLALQEAQNMRVQE